MNKRTISISLPAHFSFDECLWYLDRNYNDCMHSVNGKVLRKAVVIDKQPLLLEIIEKNKTLLIDVPAGETNTIPAVAIKEYVAGWFDINTDLQPFYDLLKKNSKLAYMVDEFDGLRLIGMPDLFEAICWCIIGQQINLAFAHKVKRRLVERYGSSIIYDGNVYHLFPTPETLANILPEELKDMQFSSMKATYLINTAKAFSGNIMSLEKIEKLADPGARQKALTELKGIGIWTANYVLMKTLKEPRAIPFGDAGLINALIRHEIIKDKKDSFAVEKFFKDFQGWESYLVFYLWRSLSAKR